MWRIEPPGIFWGVGWAFNARVVTGPSILRWAYVLFLTGLGTVAFDLLLPLAWRFAQSVGARYSPTVREALFWIGVFLLFYFVSEPIRISKRQILGWHRYPPVWFPVPLALVGFGARENWIPYVGLQRWVVGPDWPHSYPLGWCAAALALVAVSLRYRRVRYQGGPKSLSVARSRDEVTWRSINQWIEAGERPLEHHEPDFFGHRPVAEKITQTVGREGRPVALLGSLGSGKSSILNIVTARLDSMSPRVVVARVDVWEAPKPEEIPSLALNQIVGALDDLVDTIELRGLPHSYKRLAGVEPSGRLKRILEGDRSVDSLTTLERLSPILRAFNARLVLMVEDIERVGRRFDLQHLSRFLWALRRLDRCAFVVAVDRNDRLDVLKLCDTIERIPAVRVGQVAKVFRAAYDHWTSENSYIDPLPDRSEADKFLFRGTRPERLQAQSEQSGWDSPLEALVSLLGTPRSLKHVILRIHQAWSNLQGEAELDDIVILSALRHGAPDAFLFLLENIDLARDEPFVARPGTMTVKKNWESLVERLPNGGAVQQLVELLGIGQLAKSPGSDSNLSPQGVNTEEPVDYFSRIVAERLVPGELRDQEVLQHIEQWNSGRSEVLVDRLLRATESDDHYAQVWSNLAVRHAKADLIALMRVVVGRVHSICGPSTSASHPAIWFVRARCAKVLTLMQYADLIVDLASWAVPESLSLVNGLLGHVLNDRVVPDETARANIRGIVRDAVRTKLKSPDDLVRALAESDPLSLRDLSARLDGPNGLGEWSKRLAPLLIEGSPIRPDLVVPQLANWVGTEQSFARTRREGIPVFVNRYKIDRERMQSLLGIRVDEALKLLAEYQGDDERALEAKEDAITWMKERGLHAAKP